MLLEVELTMIDGFDITGRFDSAQEEDIEEYPFADECFDAMCKTEQLDPEKLVVLSEAGTRLLEEIDNGVLFQRIAGWCAAAVPLVGPGSQCPCDC